MTLSSQPPTNFIQVLPNTAITSGGATLLLGSSYIWVDATGDMRISLTSPDADTSGAVVGSQS